MTETASNFTLTETALLNNTTETGNSVSGSYLLTTTGTDTYTISETGKGRGRHRHVLAHRQRHLQRVAGRGQQPHHFKRRVQSGQQRI